MKKNDVVLVPLEAQIESCAVFFREAVAMLNNKGPDYSPLQADSYRDIRETADVIGVTVPQALFVHMRKHWSAISRFMSGEPLTSESIHGRLIDMANYCALIAAYIEHERRRPSLTMKIS